MELDRIRRILQICCQPRTPGSIKDLGALRHARKMGLIYKARGSYRTTMLGYDVLLAMDVEEKERELKKSQVALEKLRAIQTGNPHKMEQ